MWSMSLPYERHTKGVHTEKPQQVSHWSRKTPSKPSQNKEAPDSQTLHNSLLRLDQKGEGKAVHSKIEESFKQPLTPSPIFLDVFADFWMEASLCLKYYLYALFNIMKHFLESISNLLAIIFISWLLQCKNIFNICIKAKYGERSYFSQFCLPLASVEVISALVVLICPTDCADHPLHTFPSAKTYQDTIPQQSALQLCCQGNTITVTKLWKEEFISITHSKFSRSTELHAIVHTWPFVLFCQKVWADR